MEEKITPVISTVLIFEYEEVLKRNKKLLNLTEDKIDIILDNICALEKVQRIYFLWRPYLNDPKDDHVLELTVASNTKFIVTYNIKHFKDIEKFNVKAILPKKFLEVIK